MSAPIQDALSFTVFGCPKTKGSMRHIGNGRMIEDHKSSKPWREAVKWAALEAISSREGTGDPFATLSGPVWVSITFSFPKPKSVPKSRRLRPITRTSGDIDKLLRNCLDAFQDAGIFVDDSQVVYVQSRKAFVDEYPSGLATPGAEVKIWTLAETDS